MTRWLPAALRRVLTLPLVLLVGLATAFAQETVELSVEDLTGRSFWFRWLEGDQEGTNGVLVLDAEGRVSGIDSPNESAWRLDEEGRLLILHEDGEVSTTFIAFEVRDGKYCFQGPFHLREGIVHVLEEATESEANAAHRSPPPPGLGDHLRDELL